jgi:hypothetical protein
VIYNADSPYNTPDDVAYRHGWDEDEDAFGWEIPAEAPATDNAAAAA